MENRFSGLFHDKRPKATIETGTRLVEPVERKAEKLLSERAGAQPPKSD
jgi:hypothetical protein